MNRARIGLLITAAAFASVSASAIAQDAPREHREGDRGSRGAPPAVQDRRSAPAPQAAPQPQQQAQQAQPQQARPQPSGQPQGQRPGNPQGYGDRRGPDGDRRGQDGGRRFTPDGGRPPQAQPPQDQGRRFNGGDPRREGDQRGLDRNNPGRDYRGGDRRPDSPPPGNAGRGNDSRFNGQNGRQNWGQNGRGDDRRDWGRPGQNRPAWRGDWRGDRRYDWHGYRDQNRRLFRAPRYAPPRGYGLGYRAFSIGGRLDPFFYAPDYWISDPFEYRLPPVYGPYRWVRYYDDVLLVDLETGEVVDVIRDFFWQ